LDLHGLELRDFKVLYELSEASWVSSMSLMLFMGFLELLSLELHEFKAI